ncbi:unnamed protein product, partial [Iphiclides podalirius]
MAKDRRPAGAAEGSVRWKYPNTLELELSIDLCGGSKPGLPYVKLEFPDTISRNDQRASEIYHPFNSSVPCSPPDTSSRRRYICGRVSLEHSGIGSARQCAV